MISQVHADYTFYIIYWMLFLSFGDIRIGPQFWMGMNIIYKL